MSSDIQTCTHTLIIAAQHGDEVAKKTIIQMHQPLMWSLARRICSDWISVEEMKQAGNVGLLRALERYDPAQGTKLITYAVPWILGEMRKAMKAAQYSPCSLDEEIGDGNQTLRDTLVGCAGVDVVHIDLMSALSKLGYEENLLLCLRYFRDKTQKEAARIMKKSQAQISRMERQALNALQSMLS